jgi:uncharacterized membrane protein
MGSHIGLLVACGIVAATSIPLIMRIVPPNGMYGFRTSRTMADESLWYRANFFGGWALFAAALVSAMLLAAIHPQALPHPLASVALFAGPLVAAMVASLLYLRAIDRP